MQTKTASRIRKSQLGKEAITGLFNHSRYAVLAFAALWMSARLEEASLQFLALSVIFGLKWACESTKHTIQIFLQEKGD